MHAIARPGLFAPFAIRAMGIDDVSVVKRVSVGYQPLQHDGGWRYRTDSNGKTVWSSRLDHD